MCMLQKILCLMLFVKKVGLTPKKRKTMPKVKSIDYWLKRRLSQKKSSQKIKYSTI